MPMASRWSATLTAVALVAGLALTGCSAGSHVVLTVTPPASAVDTPADIRVTGVGRDTDATLALDATDADGRDWHSSVVLRADEQGVIDTASAAAPPGGSYTGVFADGLIAMLHPADTKLPASFTFPPTGPADFRFSVSVSAAVVATAVQQRALADPAVTITTLHSSDHGFDGVYAHPTDASTARPAVLLLGGSEGGNSEVLDARLLASHGVPALALAYFNAPGQPNEYPDLPKNLKDIPLEYFRTALEWLAAQPGVNPDRVRVDGASRGSEAALLSGIEFPDLVHGVAAIVPTNAARPALVFDHGRGQADPSHSAWTYRGQEIPWTNQGNVVPIDHPAAEFPVEKINGPVLLLCGGDDLVWSSCPFSQQIDKRLADAEFRFPHQLLSYPDAGHFVSIPANVSYVPDPDGAPVYGSTAQTNPLAAVDAWPKTVAFLQSS